MRGAQALQIDPAGLKACIHVASLTWRDLSQDIYNACEKLWGTELQLFGICRLKGAAALF